MIHPSKWPRGHIAKDQLRKQQLEIPFHTRKFKMLHFGAQNKKSGTKLSFSSSLLKTGSKIGNILKGVCLEELLTHPGSQENVIYVFQNNGSYCEKFRPGLASHTKASILRVVVTEMEVPNQQRHLSHGAPPLDLQLFSTMKHNRATPPS